MSKTNYIYALIDPTNNEARYIGKTINPKGRLSGHIKRTRRNNFHCQNWILRLRPLIPEMIILEEVSQDDWQKAEPFWIEYFKYLGARLTNMVPGGRGFGSGSQHPSYGKPLSEEHKIKSGQSRKGKYTGENSSFWGKHHSEETRQKLSELHSGENNPYFGKHHSEETKIKISDGGRGLTRSEETRKKISLAKTGVPRSEETKNKLRGQKRSEETKAKMRGRITSEETKNKLRARVVSEETRAKMSESARRRCAKNKNT
jgi:group I intron endonuclease